MSCTGGGSRIDFRKEGWGSSYLFEGEFGVDTMAVTSLTILSREPIAVSGQRKLFRRDGQISVVTCIVSDNGTTYAAKFERG